jgi:tetratricopeptide (TPR) repeat protein/spermidine synthase
MDKQGFRWGGSRTGLLTTLALLSGCCGLAYEVLYVRALTTILGDMFYVHAALLSTFLIGIGLGAKLAHKCLRWLWVFEVLTGLYAMVLPIASKQLSQQIVMIPITSSPSLTILTTVGLISLPSLLIGFSIPLFSAYIKAFSPERLSFQWIYRFYNLGAFLSILAVEFILVKQFGITVSLTIVGAINLFNGVVLLLMRLAPKTRPIENPRTFPKRTVAALALASLGSAIFQMFFLKLSYLVFHPHRENFAIGLSIVMLGIFIGTWWASKSRIRFETFLLMAAGLIGLIYVNYLPILRLFEATVPWARSFELLILAHKFFFGCLFALGPMIIFGALIPALMRSETEVAGESGHLLFVSSLANATGYLVYVLVGHPLLTNNLLLALIAALLVLASLLTTGLRWSKSQGILAAAGIILVALISLRWQERNFYLAHWVNELRSDDEVTVFKSGAESAVLVRAPEVRSKYGDTDLEKQEDIWENVWISYNGHPSITVQRNGVVNHAELAVGITPALTAPRLDRALVIGLGTGVSAGATSSVFTTTDVVEINKAFYKMMPDLSYANLDIEQNPSATLHLADGRAFLVGKDETYDAILSTVSAPTYFSASKIYTLDFYDRVKKSLKPDGVFSTWISAADMSSEGMDTILSALRHSFRFCELRLLRGNYYMLTCSNHPIRPRRRFSEMLAAPEHPLARQLQLALPGLDLDEFFVDTLLSENIFEHFRPQVSQENTDDHPILEFMVVRDYQLGITRSDPFFKKRDLLNINHVRRDEFKDPARFAHRAAAFYAMGEDYFSSFFPILMEDPNVRYEFFLQAAEYNAGWRDLEEAIKFLTMALEIRPYSARAHNHLGRILQSRGKLDEAISHFRQALQSKPGFAEAHYNLGYTLALQDKLDEAIKTFQEALDYNERSDLKSNMADIHFGLATALKKSNQSPQAIRQFTEAVEAYRRQVADNTVSLEIYVRLGNALTEIGDLSEAAKYFRKAVDIYPYDVENQLTLAQSLVAQERYDQAIAVLKKAIDFISHIKNKENIVKLQNYLKFVESEKPKTAA